MGSCTRNKSRYEEEYVQSVIYSHHLNSYVALVERVQYENDGTYLDNTTPISLEYELQCIDTIKSVTESIVVLPQRSYNSEFDCLKIRDVLGAKLLLSGDDNLDNSGLVLLFDFETNEIQELLVPTKKISKTRLVNDSTLLIMDGLSFALFKTNGSSALIKSSLLECGTNFTTSEDFVVYNTDNNVFSANLTSNTPLQFENLTFLFNCDTLLQGYNNITDVHKLSSKHYAVHISNKQIFLIELINGEVSVLCKLYANSVAYNIQYPNSVFFTDNFDLSITNIKE